MVRCIAPIVVALLLFGCAPRSAPGASVSQGRANRGYLQGGVALPERGEGFVRARPGERTRFGLPLLVRTLQRAFASAHRGVPGGHPMRVGDLSYRHGGRHPRHGSHRSGRDADLIFHATDLEGRSVRGRGWVRYDRFGVGQESEEHGGGIFRFDDARNWAFVRSLVMDPEAKVQWLFVSRGIKARLLRYAARHEPNREAIFRATWVLHQPSRGNPHADHFHLRIACGADQRALGCRDYGPMWPWLRDDATKGAAVVTPYDDAFLVEALLGPLGPVQLVRR